MDGVFANRVNVAASNHESRPPSDGGSPAVALALATASTIGWAASTSAGGMSSAHRIAGGCRLNHGSVAAAAAIQASISDSTSRPQPSPSAFPGMYMTSHVSVQDAG